MHYMHLGADLARVDLFYLKSLLASLALDLKTVVEKPETYTSATAALIGDKWALADDATEKYLALSQTPSGAVLLVDATNKKLAEDCAALQAAIREYTDKLAGKTPTQVPAPTQVPFYNALKPDVPFVSPPTATPGQALAPTKEITSKIVSPMTTTLTFGTKEQIARNLEMAAQHSVHITAPSAAGAGGIPTGLLIAGLVAAALALR